MKQVSGSHATCIQPSCSTRVAYRTLPVHFPYTSFTYLSKLKINEFGNAANAGKLLRYAFGPLVKNASDSIVTARLTQAMTRIKNFDLESPRGGRTVANGIGLIHHSYLVIIPFLHKHYSAKQPCFTIPAIPYINLTRSFNLHRCLCKFHHLQAG